MGIIIGSIISIIFNILLGIIKILIKIVKRILISTRLIFPVVIGGTAALLIYTNIIPNNPFNVAIAVIITALVTIYVYYRMIKKKLSKKAIEKERERERERENARFSSKKKEVNDKPTEFKDNIEIHKGDIQVISSPKIYRVKQNPGYIMYEYADRVELYKETEDGLKYIRTDLVR